jgi:putative ABC transport system permease protein
MAEVNAISPQINGRRQIIYQTKNVSTTIYGVLPSYLTVRNSKVQFGDFVTQYDVNE